MLPETRYSLIARLGRTEDHETWEAFLDTYEAAIIRYCRSRGLQDADASEVCQEVLIAVHKAAEHWQPSGRAGSFRAWLFETARRTCLKSLRSRKAKPLSDVDSIDLRDPTHEPVDEVERRETKDWQQWAFFAAAAAVQVEVEDRTWQCFWLTAVEDRTPKEVAAQLNVGLGTVYTAKCRVMGRIRAHIEQLSDFLPEPPTRSEQSFPINHEEKQS